MTDIRHIEEKIAHLTRTCDDLSDVVARQEREIAALTRRVQVLMEREAEREVAQDTPITPPPHW
ncbi:SlyX family protein [Wenxinia marina]